MNFRSGALGVAKMANMRIEISGCSASGLFNRSVSGGGEGASRLSFAIGCYAPRYNRIIEKKNCGCNKEVDIDYKYSVKLRAKSYDNYPIFCGTTAKLAVEDFAVLVAQKGNARDSAYIIDSGFGRLSTSCDAGPIDTNPITTVKDVIGGIKDVFGSGTLVKGATTLFGVFKKFINLNSACEDKDSNMTLLSGKHHIILNSDSLKSIVYYMVTRGLMSADVNGSGVAKGRLNSSGYMAGILSTIPNGEESCCDENIGSYVISSLDEFPNDDRHLDDGTHDANYSNLNLSAPMHISTLR